MIAQGTSITNPAYFDNLAAQINQIDACATLQAVVNEAMASLQAEVAAIKAQIAALLPLTTIPTDLGSVIKWITAQSSLYIKPYQQYIQQLEQTLAAIGRLASAIEAAAGKLTNCSITIPPVA